MEIKHLKSDKYKEDHIKHTLMDGDKEIGFAISRPTKGEDTIGLSELFINQEYQGNGYSKLLINDVINNYNKDIMLRANPYKNKKLNKKQLENFYSKIGFKKESDNRMRYKTANYYIDEIEKEAKLNKKHLIGAAKLGGAVGLGYGAKKLMDKEYENYVNRKNPSPRDNDVRTLRDRDKFIPSLKRSSLAATGALAGSLVGFKKGSDILKRNTTFVSKSGNAYRMNPSNVVNLTTLGAAAGATLASGIERRHAFNKLEGRYKDEIDSKILEKSKKKRNTTGSLRQPEEIIQEARKLTRRKRKMQQK